MYTQQAGHLPPGIKTASDSAVHIENVLAPPVLPKSMPRRKAGLILFPVPAETFFRAILLRILDPHGIDNRVMAPCRYSDKPLACDLIIITTPYMPSEFYGVQFPAVLGPNVIDSLDQLARRISLRACLISSDEDGNEGESKNLSRNNEFTLTIFPKPAEFVQPAEKALYHPTTRQHNKSV